MTIPIITAAQAIATVERLLADPKFGPDHVAACEYGTPDAPICIVGHILAEHDPGVWARRGGHSMGLVGVIEALLGADLVMVESDSLGDALTKAQTRQDNREPWSAAAAPILALKAA